MTEFFSGMSVMAVELGASRLLAPYFSSSQIVWTIIIGTIMIAMAIGNVWGGRSADRDPDPDRLYKRILVAAVWIAMIPAVGKYIVVGISGLLVFAINTDFLIIAAFISCMVIFVYPLMLLGTVTPSLAKYAMCDLNENGRTIGTLGAFNTAGSIIGTFLPTFVTIPAVGTSVTFLIFSGVLLALGLIYFISVKAQKVLCIISVLVFTAASVFGSSDSFAFWEKNLLYEGESVYNYLQVKDMPDSLIFSTNVLFNVESIKMKTGLLTGMFYDYDLAGPVAAGAGTSPKDILMLGNGTGTFAGQCRKYFPDSAVEAVEIDGSITKLARRFFGYPADIPTYTYDGRAFLSATDKKYDVIMVDAYQDITIPFQMSSREFFEEVRKHLDQDGVMIVNLNMYSDKPGSINEYLCDTISSVFGTVYTADVDGFSNRELYACNDGADFSVKLAGSLGSISDTQLSGLMSRISKKLVPYYGGEHILTDDKAPVELLGMRTIDGLIGDQLEYYRSALRRDGIQALYK